MLNYKNILQAELSFSPKVNCFFGNNGMGKTNLLDSIHYLSFCKSHAYTPDTQIILADEPTGALDSKTSVEVMQLLKQLNEQEGITIVVVTHESGVANETNKIVHIKDGLIEYVEDNLDHHASPFGAGGLMK